MSLLRVASILMLVALHFSAAAQQSPSPLLPYLHGIRPPRGLLLNIMGREIIVDQVKGNFSKPHVRSMFTGFDLHQHDVVFPDSIDGVKVLRIEKQRVVDSMTGYLSYYFLPIREDSIQGISIMSFKKPDEAFNREVIALIKSGIPDSLISRFRPPMLLFAGRKIEVDGRCQWMNSSTMLCSGFGEINWSMHPDMEQAAWQTSQYWYTSLGRQKFELVGEETVPVTFEGTTVTARRLTLKVKGARGRLIKTVEGSRMLIVYYVTAEVRGRFVSCVLSHWTNDYMEENGLPPLVGAVMQLK